MNENWIEGLLEKTHKYTQKDGFSNQKYNEDEKYKKSRENENEKSVKTMKLNEISSVNCNIEIKFNKTKNLYKNTKKNPHSHTQKKPTFITQINGTLNNFK